MAKNKNYRVGKSKIEGKGVFSKKNLAPGDPIGKVHTINQLYTDYDFTDLGRNHNHSNNPNVQNVLVGNERHLVAIKPIKKGEELTSDYRLQPDLEQPEDFKKGGWLDKYNPKAENGIEGTMGGLTDQGFNYNGAWGGQFDIGGKVTKAQRGFSCPKNICDSSYSGQQGGVGRLIGGIGDFLGVGKGDERKERRAERRAERLLKRGEKKKNEIDDNSEDVNTNSGGLFGGNMIPPSFENDFNNFDYFQNKLSIPGFGRTTAMGGFFRNTIPTTSPEQNATPIYGDSIVSNYTSPEANVSENLLNQGKLYDGVPGGISSESVLTAMNGASLPGSVGFMYARTNSPAPSEGPYAKKTMPSAQNGNYVKNYLNYMNQDYKDWYSVNRGDDGYDSYYYDHLQKEAPMVTTTGPAWQITQVKDPSQVWYTEELSPSDKRKVDQGKLTAKFIKDHSTTERDTSMDEFYGNLTRHLIDKNVLKQENGGSMSYYQHGLDWNPKTISEDGSIIPMAQTGLNIPGVTDFKAPRAASESTSRMVFDPITKRMVSTATTGQSKKDVAAATSDMGKYKKFEKEEEKRRVSERKSAVAAKDKGSAFKLPSGETKKYDDMSATEKLYVSGKALEQRGRFNQDEEAWYDDFANPINWITGAAGGLGTAPYEAQQSGSVMPYLSAVASPLIEGAFGFDPLGSAMKIPGLKNQLSKSFEKIVKEPVQAFGLDVGNAAYELYHPIKYAKQIKDIKKYHSGLFDRIKDPEALKRLYNTKYTKKLLSEPTFEEFSENPEKYLNLPEISTFPGARFTKQKTKSSGSHYDPYNNRINIDPSDVNIAKQYGMEMSPEAIYEHELGHWLENMVGNRGGVSSSEARQIFGLSPNNYTPSNLKNYPGYNSLPEYGKSSIEYFAKANGPKLNEAIPHMRETRQTMLEKGYIKNIYDPIDPDLMSRFVKENPKDRISSFANPSSKDQMSGLSNLFNKLPAAAGVGIGAEALMEEDGETPQQRNGGLTKAQNGLEYMDLGPTGSTNKEVRRSCGRTKHDAAMNAEAARELRKLAKEKGPEQLTEWQDITRLDKEDKKALKEQFKLIKDKYPGLDFNMLVAANRDAGRTSVQFSQPERYGQYFNPETGEFLRNTDTRNVDPFMRFYRKQFPKQTKISATDVLDVYNKMPGGVSNYQRYVDEGYFPLDQTPTNQMYGGVTKAQKGLNVPTTTDSLNLFNAQIALNKFYEDEMKKGRIKKDAVKDKFALAKASELNDENLKFYRGETERRNRFNKGMYDDFYYKYFNLLPPQLQLLEERGLKKSQHKNNHQAYYRDLITPMQNLASPFALYDERIKPQSKISYSPVGSGYPGGNVVVYDYDPLAIKPYNMRTPKEKAEWEKKYGSKKTTKSTPVEKKKPEPKVTKKSITPESVLLDNQSQQTSSKITQTPAAVASKVEMSYSPGVPGGDPVYGPGNSLIGVMNKGKFTTYKHDALNSPDKALLENQEALQKYVGQKFGKDYVKFEKGGQYSNTKQTKMVNQKAPQSWLDQYK